MVEGDIVIPGYNQPWCGSLIEPVRNRLPLINEISTLYEITRYHEGIWGIGVRITTDNFSNTGIVWWPSMNIRHVHQANRHDSSPVGV